MKLDPTMLPFDPSPYQQQGVIPYVIGIGILLVFIGWFGGLALPSAQWQVYVLNGLVIAGVAGIIVGVFSLMRADSNLYAAAKEHFHIANQGASTYYSFRLPDSVGDTVTLRGYTLRDDDGSFIIRDLVLEKREDGTYIMSYVSDKEPAS